MYNDEYKREVIENLLIKNSMDTVKQMLWYRFQKAKDDYNNCNNDLLEYEIYIRNASKFDNKLTYYQGCYDELELKLNKLQNELKLQQEIYFYFVNKYDV